MTVPKIKMKDILNVGYGDLYQRWAASERLTRGGQPSTAILKDFTDWLTVQGVDMAATYPGVPVSVVFDIYRDSYLRSRRGEIISVSGFKVDTDPDPFGDDPSSVDSP